MSPMKILRRSIVWVLMGWAAVSAQADLVMKQKVTTGGKEQSLTTRIKGDLARMDIGNEMSVIMDSATGKSTTLMHSMKTVMTVDANAMKGLMDMAAKLSGQDSEKKGDEPSIKPTGEKEKIGEWDCEIYDWNGGKGKLWICKDFDGFAEINQLSEKMSSSMGMKDNPMMLKAEELPGMVIKSEMTVMGQNAVTERVSVDKGELPDADFQAPEDYKTMSLPGGLQIPGVGGQ